MGLIDYWHIARRRWVIIAVAVVLGLIGAFGYLRTTPATYTASSSMYVSMATGTSVNDSYQGGLAAQQRIRSYLDLATSATVAQRTIDDRGLKMSVGELRGKIKADSPPASTIVVISVTDATAQGARDLADAVVAQFRQLIAELETIEKNAAPAARVAVVDKAELPSGPTAPQSKRILALGLLAGLALGGLAAFVRDRTDRTLRTSTDLAAVLADPIPGGAGYRSRVPVLGVIDAGRPGAPDETRRLRTRLTRSGESDTILTTSLSGRSEPEVAAALAKSFADTGSRVVLVDADTSNRSVTKTISEPTAGLVAVLRDAVPIAEVLTGLPGANAALLPLGEADDRTQDLLASDRFAAVLAKLRTDYDHVVVQVAPVVAAADAIAVAPLCDHTVGVVTLGATTIPQLRGALATFGDNRLSGAVAYTRPVRGLRRLIRRLRI
ncbi:GNVR domain-containing protein [Nocardia arthritidis]|uniref:Protein tyrosine kinase n=1 Tax=Nocardia arthritidis TaxID=228602 RepID=A0A6G9YF86_9NOCA|nr:GNVR domain-containing protein [Nocardia arthritidis]QIS11945.1 protein tyrosine kinase [Nocardia arthritidis]